MHLDVTELRRFYYRTQLGRIAQTAIRNALAARWSGDRRDNLAGFGFSQPFLRPFKDDAQRVVAMTPSQTGAFYWPSGAGNVSVLADERRWPLATGFVDRLLIVHALENSERPRDILAEAHRVLAPGGRAFIVAPNRTGAWARRDATPFGHGRPYSLSQLERLLREHELEPVGHSAALYAPPSQRRFWLRMAGLAERAGRRLDARHLAGVIVVEATRAAGAAPNSGVKVAARTPIQVLGGAPAPKPAASRDPVLARAGRARESKNGSD